MAIDEAILRARTTGEVPNTLRFYRWQPSAVSIGRFQNPEKELILENCQKQGVDVVRRISGGGTVYHDAEGEVTYSVIAKTEDMGAKDIAEVYSRIYAAISEALRVIGISAITFQVTQKRPNRTVTAEKSAAALKQTKVVFAA